MRRCAVIAAGVLFVALGACSARPAETESYKVADGLAVYLGVLPAAMVQGHETDPEERMHGGVPRGQHAYHVLAAVFDAATSERIGDAKVEARVTPRGLPAETHALESMAIAGTVTYGNYFTMAGSDPYRIELSITRSGAREPVEVEFAYRHGTR